MPAPRAALLSGPTIAPRLCPAIPHRRREAQYRNALAAGSRFSGAPALKLFVPGGEDAGPLRRDRHGELEVGGEGAVLGEDGPAVVSHLHQRAAGVDHRLDREDHALLELRPAAGIAEVRDLRVLVHVAAD